MAKFWAYGRHSTSKQGITEDVQRQQLEEYWKRELQPKGVEWGGFLYDSAQSASKPLTERVKGRELWAIAQPGDHIGWAKLDRAFRSVRDGVNTMELFRRKGVHIHSLDFRIDTSTPLGSFITAILLAFAELEKDFCSQRTKEALASRREKGRVWLTAPPIGWKYQGGKTKRVLVANVDERQLVDEWWNMYQSGATVESIYFFIQKRGYRRGKRGWHIRTIARAFVARAEGYPPNPVNGDRFRPRRSSRHVVGAIG